MECTLPEAWMHLGRTDDLGPPVVHVVDDDDLLREALLRTLTKFEAEVIGHDCAECFMSQFSPHRARCMILDLGLPGMSGIDLLTRLRDQRTLIPTLVLSSNDDVRSVVQSMQVGAIDFLPKPPNVELLAANVRKLLAAAPKLAAERRLVSRLTICHARLTPREREVYACMVSGRTPKQIAHDLGLRPRTAHIHCANVLTKFQVDNANDLLLLRARLASGPYGEDAIVPDHSAGTDCTNGAD